MFKLPIDQLFKLTNWDWISCYRAMEVEPTDEVSAIECGFCLHKNDDVDEPKQLPCSHIHCMGCLTAFHEVYDIIQCPVADCR